MLRPLLPFLHMPEWTKKEIIHLLFTLRAPYDFGQKKSNFESSDFYSLPFYSYLMKLSNLNFFQIWSIGFWIIVKKVKKMKKFWAENGCFSCASPGRNFWPIYMGLVSIYSERPWWGVVWLTFFNFDLTFFLQLSKILDFSKMKKTIFSAIFSPLMRKISKNRKK